MSMQFKRLAKANKGKKKPAILEMMEVEYGASLTKQSFKDSTDINVILKKAQVTGSIAHLQEHGAEYGDYAGYDLMEHMQRLERAQIIFSELPSEVRNEFNGEPAKFFSFVNDPMNVDRLPELLPLLAKPGSYDLDMSPATPPGSSVQPDKTEPIVADLETATAVKEGE